MSMNEIRVITPDSEEWPAGLRDLGSGAPEALWVRGGSLLPLAKSIAIIGARAATSYGEHAAGDFAAGLVADGYAIVGGGSYGIDGTAHRAALTAGGKTFAFMAGGVDRMYPAGHHLLGEAIVQSGGALISEQEPGATPTRQRFLDQGRLIAAASGATVVIEAGMRSGTLNTVKHALGIRRQVFAVPGPVTSATSLGSNHLISEHQARLVASSHEVTFRLT